MRNWDRDAPELDAEDTAEDTRPVLGCCEECGEEIHGSDDTHEADDAYNIQGALITTVCISILRILRFIRRVCMAVKWKVNLYGDADAEKVYQELGQENITPEEVVEKAKDPDSELHKCFEWDDKKAADKYRLQQARTLMCNLVFVTDDEKDEIRTHYALTFEKSEYHPTVLILQKPDEYKALLEKAKGELFAFKKKYSMLKELKKLFEEIDSL